MWWLFSLTTFNKQIDDLVQEPRPTGSFWSWKVQLCLFLKILNDLDAFTWLKNTLLIWCLYCKWSSISVFYTFPRMRKFSSQKNRPRRGRFWLKLSDFEAIENWILSAPQAKILPFSRSRLRICFNFWRFSGKNTNILGEYFEEHFWKISQNGKFYSKNANKYRR